jgi:phosphate transport system substrate-binding protein
MTRVRTGGVSRRAVLAGVAGSLATAGCIERRAAAERPSGNDRGGPLTGDIGIAGSSTVFPLTVAMRTEFIAEYPEVRVSLQSTGTGGGFGNFFCTGDRAINNASRPITESERAQCGDNGIEPLELRVATDALTLIVNTDADWVDCLTVEEVAQIWRPGGAQRWSDVRDDWPDEPFELYGPASTSGTFDYFTEAVVGESGAHRQDYAPTEDDNTIVTGVSGSEYATGYFGFAHYQGNSDAVKAVAVADGTTDAGCVDPSLDTAAKGAYTPLSRPLFIYVNRNALARRAVAAFCRFYLRHTTSRELVGESVGYVPLTDEQRAIQRGRLERAIDEATDDRSQA